MGVGIYRILFYWRRILINMASLIQESQFVSFFIYDPTLGAKEGTVTFGILDLCLQAAVINNWPNACPLLNAHGVLQYQNFRYYQVHSQSPFH